jgi:uncharacterized protein YcfL
MKGFYVLLLIVSLLVLSGCSENKQVDQQNDTVLANHVINNADRVISFIDCKHSVICYNEGALASGLSCVYIPSIQECQ